jgi:hypothetical protein
MIDLPVDSAVHGGWTGARTDSGANQGASMHRVTLDSVLVRRGRVIAKSSGGSLVLLDIDSGEYFSTNDVGALIWELIDGARSVSAIAEAVAAEFEVELDVVQGDVMELVDELAREALLLRPEQ